jgi:cystathionine beta-lyase/cystathionine gamma-synthase
MPIFQNSLFTFASVGEMAKAFHHGGEGDVPFFYSRYRNPTVEETERKVAALEGAETARAFGSGMAAVAAAVLGSVSAGGHVVTVDSVYWPTRKLFECYLPRFGVETTFVDGRSPDDFAAALQKNTQLVYLETPSTGLYHLQDIRAVSDIAHGAGATVVVDNSWATPIFQRPLELGADLSLHSMTKYMGGHSDVIAGVLAGSRERMGPIVENEGALLGGVLSPFDAWLVTRGMRTLPLRMRAVCEQALGVARFLSGHPKVARVNHPGLPEYPQRDLAERQMSGCSGVFSFELASEDPKAAVRVLDALRVFHIGISWGGFESLAFIPELASTPDPSPRTPVRLTIGLEPAEALKEDLASALEFA